MRVPAGLIVVVAMAVARMLPGAAVQQRDSAHEFLKTQFALRDSELSALLRYRPVTRTLDTADGREVATLGVARMRVPADFYIDQLRRIADFKRNESVPQIGVFGDPARLDDVRDLTLDAGDVDALQRCRPRACGLQLSSDAIARFQHEAGRTTPDRAAAMTRVMREVLVELVNGYRRAGDRALMTYTDSDRPVTVAGEFRAMVDARPAILRRFPPLDQHILQFPRSDAATEDLIYWSREKLGPRIVLSVTHLAITRLTDRAPAIFVAASRQLYGSHYFDASLGVTILLQDGAGPAPGSYLVYVNRSRLDVLGGFFGGLKRAIVQSRTRSAAATSLTEARDTAERRFAAAGAVRERQGRRFFSAIPTMVPPHTVGR